MQGVAPADFGGYRLNDLSTLSELPEFPAQSYGPIYTKTGDGEVGKSGLDVDACPYTRDDWIEFWQRGWFDYWF